MAHPQEKPTSVPGRKDSYQRDTEVEWQIRLHVVMRLTVSGRADRIDRHGPGRRGRVDGVALYVGRPVTGLRTLLSRIAGGLGAVCVGWHLLTRQAMPGLAADLSQHVGRQSRSLAL